MAIIETNKKMKVRVRLYEVNKKKLVKYNKNSFFASCVIGKTTLPHSRKIIQSSHISIYLCFIATFKAGKSGIVLR